MNEIINWLLRDEQSDLFEFLLAVAVNLVFLGLVAVLFWPLHKLALAWHWAKGFGVLWVALWTTGVFLSVVHRLGRMDLYHHYGAYEISILVLLGVLLAGWAAFVALSVREAMADAPLVVAVLLYAAAVLACMVALYVSGTVYRGTLSWLVGLVVVAVSLVVFSVWPTVGRALYGWFFALF